MFNDFKSPSFIIGVSILILVPFGMGGIIYGALRDDDAQQQADSNSSPPEDVSFEGLARESNLPPGTVASPNTSASGESLNPSSGIPIGKYSNPPTKITTSGLDVPRPSNNLGTVSSGSSINSSKISSHPTLPNYSTADSGNNLQRIEEESLITPLETNELLETLPSNLERTNSFMPTTEPLFQP